MSETIRPCTLADAEAMAALAGSLAHYFVGDPGAASVQPFLATFRPAVMAELLAKPDFLCLGAEADSRLLGFITLHRPAHVHHLFVSPEAHRRGIARALWQAIQPALPAATPVTVNASEFAVAVYQRLGFTASAGLQERNGVRYIPMRTAPNHSGTES